MIPRRLRGLFANEFPELCRKCGHRRDSHDITQDGYACVRCKCRRRFWR